MQTKLTYTREDIQYLYNRLKNIAWISYRKKQVSKCLKYLHLSAIVGYHFNSFFKDDESDKLLESIGEQIYSPKNLDKSFDTKIVLLDSFDNPKVLTVQYLRALIQLNVSFLYIVENVSDCMNGYYEEVTKSKQGTIYLLKTLYFQDRALEISKCLDAYNPTHILCHITPWDTSGLAAISTRRNAIKYNINLTDEAFWLGAGIFDYVLEFRDFGATLSYEKRGFSKKQILLNPYYPLIRNSKFEGFPCSTNNQVIIFSGGSYNKILGDNDKFLSLVERILQENTNVIFFYAGMGVGRTVVERFINKKKLNNRFVLLGERKDIDQVFLNSDIFISTYPISGGLMSLYAAYFSKPIVAYVKNLRADDIVEDMIFVNKLRSVKCTFDSDEDFLNEVQKLVKYDDYRKEQGRLLKEGMTNIDNFVINLRDNIFYHKSRYNQLLDIDYSVISDKYIELYNLGANTHVNVMLIKGMGFGLYKLRFKFICDMFLSVFKLILERIKISILM